VFWFYLVESSVSVLGECLAGGVPINIVLSVALDLFSQSTDFGRMDRREGQQLPDIFSNNHFGKYAIAAHLETMGEEISHPIIRFDGTELFSSVC